MILLEYSSKKILSDNFINVPDNQLIKADEPLPRFRSPCVVKAQVPFGGRGKSGLVKMVNSEDEYRNYIAELFSEPKRGYRIDRVLVEEKIEVQNEYYLSFTINRDLQNIKLIFSRFGGVEIESVDPANIFSFDIDPLMGLQEYMIRKVATVFFNGIQDRSQYNEADSMTRKLYDVFLKYNATLLEINPLVLTRDGKLAALDAKVVIDDNAEEVQKNLLSSNEEVRTFEAMLSRYGVNASRLDGDIAVVTSGAGLMMATVDLISTFGGKAGPCIDLGGTVFQLIKEEQIFSEILQQVLLQSPSVILFNAFFQLARSDDLAQAIRAAFSRLKVDVPVIIRLKGMREKEAAEILNGMENFTFVEDLVTACKKAVELAGGI